MRAEPVTRRQGVIGFAVAVLAGLHKAILTSTPVNDDYQHLAYARQLLAGDLPLRDFWDLSTTLQVVLSAVSELIFGHRLLGEAVVVGLCTAIAVFLVFRVVHRASGSTPVAVVCAAFFIVAVPRVYAYPKWIVYAAAADLWWTYVWRPSRGRAVALGAWTAVAFYWRHDHGVLVAIGTATAFLAAHGFAAEAVRRTALSAAIAVTLVTPYLVFAAVEVGLLDLARTELIALDDENSRSRAGLRWPLRAPSDYFRTEPRDTYAPVMTVRWRADASAADRSAALEKFGLTPIAGDGPHAQVVRLSQRSLDSLRALIDDPIVEDTAGVERGSARFTWTQWRVWNRLRFHVAPLRFTVLGGVDPPLAAGVTAALLVQWVPATCAVLLLPGLRRRLPSAVTPSALLWFVAFAVVVNFGLLREPYESRVADVIVLPAILFGILLTVLWWGTHAPLKWLLRAVAIVMLSVAARSLANAGEFGDRIAWLAGDGQSLERATGAWREVAGRLVASPPSAFWAGRKPPVTFLLAQYARRCVAPTDRVLVLWFAPELHFDADRLMAGRHLYYFAPFNRLDAEQEREVAKVTRSAPPIVFANGNNYASTADAFPRLRELIERDYVTAASFDDEGDRFSILRRKAAPPPATDRETGWPCYTSS